MKFSNINEAYEEFRSYAAETGIDREQDYWNREEELFYDFLLGKEEDYLIDDFTLDEEA